MSTSVSKINNTYQVSFYNENNGERTSIGSYPTSAKTLIEIRKLKMKCLESLIG